MSQLQTSPYFSKYYTNGAGYGFSRLIPSLCSQPPFGRIAIIRVNEFPIYTANAIPTLIGDFAEIPRDNGLVTCSETGQVCQSNANTFMGALGFSRDAWSCCSKEGFRDYFESVTSDGTPFCLDEGGNLFL